MAGVMGKYWGTWGEYWGLYIFFFVSNHHPLYFCISLTGLFIFITHVIQYNSKQIS